METLRNIWVSIFLNFLTLSSLQAGILGLASDSTCADKNNGWGKSLQLFMKDSVSVRNLAVGGATTKSFMADGRWKNLLDLRPQFVFVQFAHNDSSKKISLKDYKNYLKKYITEARAQKAEVYLVTPPHRCRFKNGVAADELRPYVDAMKSVAKLNDVGLLDLYKRSGDFLTSYGKKACAEYYDSSDSANSHFNIKGSKKAASLVAEEAKKQPLLSSYVKQ